MEYLNYILKASLTNPEYIYIKLLLFLKRILTNTREEYGKERKKQEKEGRKKWDKKRWGLEKHFQYLEEHLHEKCNIGPKQFFFTNIVNHFT